MIFSGARDIREISALSIISLDQNVSSIDWLTRLDINKVFSLLCRVFDFVCSHDSDLRIVNLCQQLPVFGLSDLEKKLSSLKLLSQPPLETKPLTMNLL